MAFGGFLRQSTAVDVLIGPFVSSTDGDTEMTGLSITQATVLLSKNGQTGAQKNDNTTAAHDADGFYNCELDATDTNTVGQLTLWVHIATSLAVRHDYQVVDTAAYDLLFADGATGAVTVASGGIASTAFATGAITAAALAADAGAEIADAVWDEDATGHQTGGTFGQAIGDPGADTTTIYGATVTAAAGTHIAADIIAIKAETAAILEDTGTTLDDLVDNLETRLGTPSDLGSGATVAANLVDIEAQTDDIGAAGAGLTEAGGTGDQFTAIVWNANWDAEVQSEVTDALVAYDPPTRAELTTDINSVLNILQGLVLEQGTIGATGNDSTHLHLAGLTYGDDELNGYFIVVFDVSTSEYHVTDITDWADAGDLATVSTLPFTPEASVDTYWLLYSQAGSSGAPTAAEVADAVWDEAQADHVAAGSFGETATEIAAVLVDTSTTLDDFVDDLEARLGTPSDLGSGATIAANLVDIEAQTDDIGAAGAGLTAINLPDQTMNIIGNITGNLSGSVGSVTGNVGGTVNGLTATAVADLFDTDSGTTYASAVAGSVVKEIADNAGGASLTAEEIADAVWDEVATGHTDAGKAGEQLWTDVDAILVDTSTTLDDLVDNLETRLGTPSDLGSGATIAANLVDIEAQTDDIATVVTAVDTEVAAILTDTNELQTDWTDGGRLDLILDARASQTSVDDIPTNTELATEIDSVQTDIAALNDITVADILTTALADAYAANGAAPTLQQAIMAVHQAIMDFAIVGTSKTVKKLGGTDAFVITHDSATAPTSAARD